MDCVWIIGIGSRGPGGPWAAGYTGGVKLQLSHLRVIPPSSGVVEIFHAEPCALALGRDSWPVVSSPSSGYEVQAG